MAKRFYFESENENFTPNDHIGNIRGARTKAEKLSLEWHIDVTINDAETDEIIETVFYEDVAEQTESTETVAEQTESVFNDESDIATESEMKAEAIRRMKAMKLFPQTINNFKNEDIVTNSETIGMLFWADDNQQKIIADFESRFGAKVFHCIKSYTDYGEIYTMLFVSKYKSEWQMDWDNISRESHIAYALADYDTMMADMGDIGYKSMYGGLVRTW